MSIKNRVCLDCGKPIWSTSIRCPHCSHLGKRNAFWKGGKIIHCDGYIMVRKPDHPRATPVGYVLEHRLVMERTVGRYLETDEVVHHINGDKKDNREENLELRENMEHLNEHYRKWQERKESSHD